MEAYRDKEVWGRVYPFNSRFVRPEVCLYLVGSEKSLPLTRIEFRLLLTELPVY
jgi:hypothetical protein